jgi:hypothetical protein
LEESRNCNGVTAAIAEKALVSTVLLAVTISVFYGAEAMVTRHAAASWLVTRWDEKIPLLPSAVWIYLSWYLAPWLVLAAPTSKFRRVAGAIVLAFTVCMVCYVLFPAFIERPAVAGRSLSERALRSLYEHDPPWNIFPSFHAAMCAVLWLSTAGGPLAKWGMTIWMAAICGACVLTKQHNILDVAAGILVGVGALATVSAVLRHLRGLNASTTTGGS